MRVNKPSSSRWCRDAWAGTWWCQFAPHSWPSHHQSLESNPTHNLDASRQNSMDMRTSKAQEYGSHHASNLDLHNVEVGVVVTVNRSFLTSKFVLSSFTLYPFLEVFYLLFNFHWVLIWLCLQFRTFQLCWVMPTVKFANFCLCCLCICHCSCFGAWSFNFLFARTRGFPVVVGVTVW